MRLLNIGFSNMINAEKIVAVLAPDSAPVKRIVAEARENGRLMDATAGRRTRAVLMMDGGNVVLSAVQPETIAGRMHSDTEEGKGK